MFVAFFIALSAINLPSIINPPPLSKARERALVQVSLFSIILVGVEIFAEE